MGFQSPCGDSLLPDALVASYLRTAMGAFQSPCGDFLVPDKLKISNGYLTVGLLVSIPLRGFFDA